MEPYGRDEAGVPRDGEDAPAAAGDSARLDDEPDRGVWDWSREDPE